MLNRKYKLGLYKLNRSLHRDIGYLTVGFTLIFSISGIAVNHIQDWNPNYNLSRTESTIPTIETQEREEMVRHVLRHASLNAPVKSSFRSSPDELKIFFDGGTLSYNNRTGSVIEERIQERTLLLI